MIFYKYNTDEFEDAVEVIKKKQKGGKLTRALLTLNELKSWINEHSKICKIPSQPVETTTTTTTKSSTSKRKMQGKTEENPVQKKQHCENNIK